MLVGLTLVAWILTFDRMRGMDAGPGTDLGGLGWFVGHLGDDDGGDDAAVGGADGARVRPGDEGASRRQQAIYVPPWIFLPATSAPGRPTGSLAYGVFRAIDAVAGSWLAWDRAGPYVAGGAIASPVSTN